MAKSIRLKAETQERVAQERAAMAELSRLTVSDAQVVDMLVNEALDAREKGEKKKVRR